METLHTNQEVIVSDTPETDKVFAATRRAVPDIDESEFTLYRAGFTMAGRGYAEVLARYVRDEIEDGARDELYEYYTHAVGLHIPAEVADQFDEGTHQDILDEYTQLMAHQAEIDILLAPAIDKLTVESLHPTQEQLHDRQIMIYATELKEARAEITRLNLEKLAAENEIAQLKQDVAELNGRLDVTVDGEPDVQARKLGHVGIASA